MGKSSAVIWNAHWVRLPGDLPHHYSSLVVTGMPSVHRAVHALRAGVESPSSRALKGVMCEELDHALRTSAGRRERGHLLPPSARERAMVEHVHGAAPLRWVPDENGRVEAHVFRPTAAAYVHR